MKLGLGLGLGSGNRLPRYVTDYFNGFELSGSTFSGGQTVVPDNTGVLVTSPAGVLPIEGMRLATTVAEGAVLGDELISSLNLQTGTWVATSATILSPNSFTATSVSGRVYSGLSGVLVLGRKYLITVSGVVDAGNYRLWTSGAQTLLSGNGTIERVIASINEPYIVIEQAGATLSNLELSIREVIPTWVPTTSLSAPIHPSTPLRTRKGTVSVYGEDFRGPLIEPARTNKCTCRKANPVDTTKIAVDGGDLTDLTLVDMSEALLSSGLSHICTSGLVYRLDNSTSGANRYARCVGPAGNTNPHTMSAYICGTGKGGVRKSGLSGAGSVEHINLTDSFVRVSDMGNAAAIASEGSIVANPYSVVYFILPQLEEGTFCTSPICQASDGSDPLTALTRPAANLTRPTAGSGLETGNNFAVYGRVVPKAGGQGDRMLLATYFENPAANFTTVQASSSAGTVLFRKFINGSIVAEPSISYDYATNTPFEYLVYQHSVHGMGIAVRSWNGSAWSAWSTWATNADTQNAPIGSTYQIGARNNSLHFAANYPFTKIIALNPALNPQSQLADLLAKGRI